MNPYNVCTFVGRIPTTDKIRYAYSEAGESGRSRMNGAFSVKRSYKAKDEQYYKEDLINFVAFGAQADYMHNYVKRGDTVAVSGSLQVDKIVDSDGNSRTYTSIVIDNVRNVYGGNNNNANGNNGSAQNNVEEEEEETPRASSPTGSKGNPFHGKS